MKTFKLLTGLALALGTALSVHAAKPATDHVYQQAYALYVLYHPENKAQKSSTLIQQYSADYADLFKQQKSIDALQFNAFEQSRLTDLMEKRREMSLKQTYVRYGILDQNKDQKLSLKEFQVTGMKTFDEFDKNQDGVVNAIDAQLAGANTATHDGFRIKLPISMPMPSNVNEFIQTYGEVQQQVTLADYLHARDQQFFATDANQDLVVTEKEYVDEFMQRFDANSKTGLSKMQELSAEKFNLIAQGKSHIQAADLQKFAKKMDQAISQ